MINILRELCLLYSYLKSSVLSVCPLDKYGARCTQTCWCGRRGCNMTGQCLNHCPPGWKDSNNGCGTREYLVCLITVRGYSGCNTSNILLLSDYIATSQDYYIVLQYLDRGK